MVDKDYNNGDALCYHDLRSLLVLISDFRFRLLVSSCISKFAKKNPFFVIHLSSLTNCLSLEIFPQYLPITILVLQQQLSKLSQTHRRCDQSPLWRHCKEVPISHGHPECRRQCRSSRREKWNSPVAVPFPGYGTIGEYWDQMVFLKSYP